MELYEKQGGRCAISNKPITIGRKKGADNHAVVDHCHQTGKVRGLLCPRTNIAMGIFEDNPELLRKAAEYLDKHKENNET